MSCFIFFARGPLEQMKHSEATPTCQLVLNRTCSVFKNMHMFPYKFHIIPCSFQKNICNFSPPPPRPPSDNNKQQNLRCFQQHQEKHDSASELRKWMASTIHRLKNRGKSHWEKSSSDIFPTEMLDVLFKSFIATWKPVRFSIGRFLQQSLLTFM